MRLFPALSRRLLLLTFVPACAFLVPPSIGATTAAATQADWPTYLGDKQRTLYSPLRQIDRANVAKLTVAWTYDTGEKGEYQCNNLIVDGVLFTATQSRKVVALDAATGREIWKWDPASDRSGPGGRRQRGLVYWKSESGAEQRLFTATGNYLFALDPKTGKVIPSFGDKGAIELGSGLDVDGTPRVGLNTPGVIYKDMLIIGGFGGPGAVRGLDVRTGERRWIFHLIPRPGEFGHDTWPAEAYKTATGVMPWAGQSLDEQRGIVYVSTKTAEPDFWGGERHGANLFANSLVALDANTGRRLWHYQIVHHDLLDKDLPCPPILLTVTHGGKKIDAVAQGTKHGQLFVFNRVTGEPLWPIEEKPVPASQLSGEKAWPTQPFPTKPAALMRQQYTESDVSNISPEARALTTDRIKLSPNFGPFPAPSLKETIMFPGFDGGMEWGGGAADPDGVYYVNINEIPWIMQMVETRRADGSPQARGEREFLIHCAACHGLDRAGFPLAGFPSLIDLEKRRTRAEIAQITKTGFGRMPAFDRIPDQQRDAILSYVLGESRPPTAGRPDEETNGKRPARKGPPYAFGGFRRWTDQAGYPAIKPPWGTLNAVDLNTGELKWKVPLGEYRDLTARGIPPTGTENYGGPVVTAGGILFIAASADETIRAFDKSTGKVLWQASLPFSGNATPSTYMVNGRQFVVISAGGAKSGRPAGGALVAFALPSPNTTTILSGTRIPACESGDESPEVHHAWKARATSVAALSRGVRSSGWIKPQGRMGFAIPADATFATARAARPAVSRGMKQEIEDHYESVSGSKAVEQLRAVAKSANICLFGTDVSHPPLTVRPMAVQSVDDAGNFWFLSSRTSHTNQHIGRDPRVQLLFANPATSEYLTLQGTATISDDPSLKKEHWTPIAKTWFNEGLDDPDLTVIRVEPHDGYYWDTKHGKAVAALKIAVGAVVGKTLDDSIEGKVRL